MLASLLVKVVEKLTEFPATKPKLKGVGLEAHSLLETVTADKPVLVVSPDGANVAAIKRAFVAAAKVRGGSVDTRNGENGTVLVRWSSTARQRRTSAAKPRVQHSDKSIEAEMKRLYLAAGNRETDFSKLSADARRKLSISAKRNLSRRSRA